jgi:hypothetical protein
MAGSAMKRRLHLSLSASRMRDSSGKARRK